MLELRPGTVCALLPGLAAGSNSVGQLGTGGEPDASSVPLPVAGDSVYSSIHAAVWANFACGIVSAPGTPQDKTLECWWAACCGA